MGLWLITIGAFVILFVSTIMYLAGRYRRCPSDKILVVYGKVAQDRSCKCIHGGGTMVWPLIQDYAYLSLTPMTISIPLQNALSFQNIRINVPSTFTVGISTDPSIMNNAAERLLGLQQHAIEDMAKEIIFGQLRLTVASLTIEQINQDRESFLESIRKNVEPELNKIGLYLINVNITDITDESTYIDSIGKKAAAEAINRAKIDVADQLKLGAIGEAQANRERDIRVAENLAEADKGKKKAEAERRIFVESQEAAAVTGENTAQGEIAGTNAVLAIKEAQAAAEAEKGRKKAEAERDIRVAESMAEADKGKKKAEAERRIFVENQEADAVKGENLAKADIADSAAELAVKQATAQQLGEVARLKALAEIQKSQYLAEQERLIAEEVVRKEIDKRKIEISADAEAERIRREARGEADGILLKYEAEATGMQKLLEGKALGYAELVKSCSGDAKAAATLLMIEKLENIVARQVEAISNLKIDKITVWDSAGDGKGSSTAQFVSGLVKSLPPLQDIASMAGVELPEYLGKMAETDEKTPAVKKPDSGAKPV